MNESTINLVLQLGALAAKLALEIKQQSGLENEQLLELAEKNNAETRDSVKAFLESLP